MFEKKRRIKKHKKELRPQAKKAVTSTLIMTVVALSLCFGILIGGIETNADITDIFTNEPDDVESADEGSVPISYDNSKTVAIFDISDENNIKLNYYNGENQFEKQIVFSFDDSARIIGVGEKIQSPEEKKDNKKDAPASEKTSEKDSDDIIPILEFEYESDSVVRRREYRDSVLYETQKTETTVGRDSSRTVKKTTYASNAELIKSEEYVFDKYGNTVFYAFYNNNNEQISGFSRVYTYDSNGNIVSSRLTDYGKDPIECVYRYDERNNLVYSSTFNKDLATVVTTYAYVYDSKSRITQATKSVSYASTSTSDVTDEKYEYDSDNLISKTITDSSQHILFDASYVYSAENKLIRSTQTDSAGENAVTVGYEYLSDSLYDKMNEIESVWDALSCSPKDENAQ